MILNCILRDSSIHLTHTDENYSTFYLQVYIVNSFKTDSVVLPVSVMTNWPSFIDLSLRMQFLVIEEHSDAISQTD